MSLHNASFPAAPEAPEQRVISPLPPRQWKRDAAIDFFRGFGLWMIFLDHLDPNILSHMTLRQFGLSDFAEVFVFLSGFMSVGSWEKVLSQGNALVVFKQLGRRMARLYFAQIAALSISIALLGAFAERGVRFHDPSMYFWMSDPAHYLVQGLTLLYAPSFFRLLLLYIMVSPGLPLVVLGLKRAPKLTLGLSFGLWALIQFPPFHSVGLNWHWYFNPLAWQFLFVLGAAVRCYSNRLAPIVRKPWALGSAALVVAASFALKSLTFFPWTRQRTNPRLLATLIFDPEKPDLAAYRVVHFLALAILVYAFTSRHRRWLESPAAGWAIACGRGALLVLASSLVLDTAGDLILTATHGGIPMQLAISASGIAVLSIVAWLRGREPLTFKRPLILNQIRNSIE
jgi:hypothetical protein